MSSESKIVGIPADVVQAATSLQKNGYRGPIAWAVKVIDFVANYSESKEQHTDDDAVDLFAAAMKAKMAKQRAKGYGGWNNKQECEAGRLQKLLLDHIVKGDPVDVGNFAMMLFNRGEKTKADASQQGPIGKLTVDAYSDSGIGIEFTIKNPEEVLFVGQLVYVDAQEFAAGWQMVPVEPTKEMARAGGYHYCQQFVNDYRKVIAAAPALRLPNKKGGST